MDGASSTNSHEGRRFLRGEFRHGFSGKNCLEDHLDPQRYFRGFFRKVCRERPWILLRSYPDHLIRIECSGCTPLCVRLHPCLAPPGVHVLHSWPVAL